MKHPFLCPAMPVTGARTVLPTRARIGCGEPGRLHGTALNTTPVLVVTRLHKKVDHHAPACFLAGAK
jgi:hypothetical protein